MSQFIHLEQSAFRRGGIGCLGVSRVLEFQSSKNKFERRQCVAKIQKTKECPIVSIHFVSNLTSSCSIDLVLQVFNFPHLNLRDFRKLEASIECLFCWSVQLQSMTQLLLYLTIVHMRRAESTTNQFNK